MSAIPSRECRIFAFVIHSAIIVLGFRKNYYYKKQQGQMVICNPLILYRTPYVDVFSCGIWSQFEGIEDDELRDLVSSLLGVVFSGRAATTKKYSGAFSRWKRWASTKQEVQVIPVPNPFLWHYISITCYKDPR